MNITYCLREEEIASMKLKENTTRSLSLANNSTVVNDQVFKKLLEFTYIELLDLQSPKQNHLLTTLCREAKCVAFKSCDCKLKSYFRMFQDITSICNSKPDIIKEIYATFLTAVAEFGRNDCGEEEVASYLAKECGYSARRASSFSQEYGKNKLRLQIKLGNIGTHLPHIVDVDWKIDYIVKASTLDVSEGPLFRVSLITERYDTAMESKKVEPVKFSCSAEELQDLVYKLRDAVRHCHKIGGE